MNIVNSKQIITTLVQLVPA